jgi:DNA repair exonuclease SbcCD nuclease subunit
LTSSQSASALTADPAFVADHASATKASRDAIGVGENWRIALDYGFCAEPIENGPFAQRGKRRGRPSAGMEADSMTHVALRFVHAGDFHLEQPLAGISDAPEAMRPLFVDAAYRAAVAVFDTAIDRQVDFVVLTGGLVDPRRAGPRGLATLVAQFERLDAAGIAVYWLTGEIDAVDRWPEAVELPTNVRRIDAGRGECLLHWRGGVSIARLGPLAALPRRERVLESASTSHRAGSEPFTVGLARGTPRLAAGEAPFDYLALGGEMGRHIVHSGAPWVVHAGSPQGRSIRQSGPHGCTLVEVEDTGHVRVALRTTDAVRWRDEQLSLDDCPSRSRWEAMLRDRLAVVAAEAGDRAVLLRLRLLPGNSRTARSAREQLAADMLAWLRETYAKEPQTIWTLAVDHCPAADVGDEAVEEDTILGEFLRTVDEVRSSDGEEFDWMAYVGATALEDDLLRRLAPRSDDERERLLRHVAELGRELLRGEPGTAAAASTFKPCGAVRIGSAV